MRVFSRSLCLRQLFPPRMMKLFAVPVMILASAVSAARISAHPATRLQSSRTSMKTNASRHAQLKLPLSLVNALIANHHVIHARDHLQYARCAITAKEENSCSTTLVTMTALSSTPMMIETALTSVSDVLLVVTNAMLPTLPSASIVEKNSSCSMTPAVALALRAGKERTASVLTSQMISKFFTSLSWLVHYSSR